TTLLGNNTIGVQQSFSFLTVYIKQSKVLKQQLSLSKKAFAISKNDLIQKVRSAYYQMTYGVARLQLLTYQDSVYANFAKAANVRYTSGESKYLEKVAADAQYQQVLLQKKQAQKDLQIDEQELQKWLNTNRRLQVTIPLEKVNMSINEDSSALPQNPVLDYYLQNINVSKALLSLERTRLLPDFTVGYSKQTENGNTGFYGYQIGISIPLWFRPQKARIQSADIATKIAHADYENTRNDLITTYNQQLKEYQKWQEQLAYYDSSGLQQSEAIIKNAQTNYTSGNISYIEYIQDLTEAFDIRLQYLNALNQNNQTVIYINYLLGK
ncbi:MAG: TolC family protein, partial [Ginsengibacter sp.]